MDKERVSTEKNTEASAVDEIIGFTVLADASGRVCGTWSWIGCHGCISAYFVPGEMMQVQREK